MEKLFLQILNMSISAIYLILAIVAIRFLLKKTPKWINVLLWGLVAVRLLCPFTPESMFSLIPKAQAVSPEILAPEVPNTNLDGGSFESGEIGTMGEIAGTGTIGESPVLPPVSDVEPLPSAPVSDAVDPQNVMAVLAVIWAVGVVVMLAYVAYSYGRIRKKVGMAVPMGNGIYQSDQIDSAFVLGILKPKIYLPFSLKEKNINHVVSHERAHIRRRDHLWKPLGFLLLALHWFNPLMWVAFTLFCQDVEMACDEKVIAKFDYMERAAYSEALLSCSVKRRKKFAYPLTFGEIDTKGRVKSVLNYKKPKFWVMFLSLICCVVVAVCFLTNPVSGDDETEQETTLENDTADTTEEITTEAPAPAYEMTPSPNNAHLYESKIPGKFIDYEILGYCHGFSTSGYYLGSNANNGEPNCFTFYTASEVKEFLSCLKNINPKNEREKNEKIKFITTLEDEIKQVNFATHSIIILQAKYGLCDYIISGEIGTQISVNERFYLDALAVQENRVVAVYSSVATGLDHSLYNQLVALIVRKEDLPSKGYSIRICGYSSVDPDAHTNYYFHYEDEEEYWKEETEVDTK